MEFSNIEVLELPDISEVSFNGIEKDYLKIIIVRISTLFFLAFLILLLLDFYVPEVSQFDHVNTLYIGIILGYVFVLTCGFVGFSKKGYAVRERDVSYKRGLLMKTITTVPFSRIQHVEINESPMARLLKMASLVIFTAGDSSNDLVIRGLRKNEALKIKEFINQQINE